MKSTNHPTHHTADKSTFKKNVRQLALLLLAGLVTIPLLSCGRSKIAWKEEVQLQSGEIITVQRTAKTKAFGEIGGPGGWENEGMTIKIDLPDAKESPPIWNEKFAPLLLDRDKENKQWFIVATFYSCESWYSLGKPKLPYTEFRVKNGKWVQQPLSAELIGRKANMLTNIRASGEHDHTIASKEGVNLDPRIGPEYKAIVNHWSTGC